MPTNTFLILLFITFILSVVLRHAGVIIHYHLVNREDIPVIVRFQRISFPIRRMRYRFLELILIVKTFQVNQAVETGKGKFTPSLIQHDTERFVVIGSRKVDIPLDATIAQGVDKNG